jgi:hypothetical protein
VNVIIPGFCGAGAEIDEERGSSAGPGSAGPSSLIFDLRALDADARVGQMVSQRLGAPAASPGRDSRRSGRDRTHRWRWTAPFRRTFHRPRINEKHVARQPAGVPARCRALRWWWVLTIEHYRWVASLGPRAGNHGIGGGGQRDAYCAQPRCRQKPTQAWAAAGRNGCGHVFS